MSEQRFFDNWKNKKEKVNYNCKGDKNSKSYKAFKDICRMTQMKLKDYLVDKLCNYYETIYVDDGFIYVKGINSNVLLTAHMDTVHEPRGLICTDIYEYYDRKNKRHILSSPQGIGGDDRCGIYAILKVLETTDFRPYIIFCEDEEIGGVGSNKFCKTTLSNEVADEVNFMIEIDRANANDAVFYEETNAEFQRYVMDVTGNKEAWGSFSDICHLSEDTLVSSFNISCGYYNAHTTDEYVVMEELNECIKKVIKLLETNKSDSKKFIYERDYYDYYRYNSSFKNSYGYGNYYGYDSGYYETQFFYYDPKTKKDTHTITEGRSLEECIGELMMLNPDLKWSDVYDYEEYN